MAKKGGSGGNGISAVIGIILGVILIMLYKAHGG